MSFFCAGSNPGSYAVIIIVYFKKKKKNLETILLLGGETGKPVSVWPIYDPELF